ncbi:MAG: flagellar biosynthetic protein FliR [Planctomycetota bacterium]|jgi:flagellar biosynthetic protein FliR
MQQPTSPDFESLIWSVSALIADWGSLPALMAILTTRWIGMVSFTPGLGTETVGLRFRSVLAIFMAGVMAPGMDPDSVQLPNEVSGWLMMILAEFLIGALLGLSVSLWISAARSAGQWAALVSGLSMQTTYQPDMDGDAENPPTAVGRLFSMMGLFLFFSGRGPLRLLDLVDGSLSAWPPGTPLQWPTQLNAESLLRTVNEALALSILAAWPIIVALITAQIAVALAMRTQSLVLSLSLMAPTRLAAGLVILAAGLAGLSAGLAGTLDPWLRSSVGQLGIETQDTSHFSGQAAEDTAETDAAPVIPETQNP